MTWPWVSRAMYDHAFKLAEDAVAVTVQQRQEYRELLEKYHALKVVGASIPDPTPTLERPQPDPVLMAITAKAGPDRILRSRMAREAMRARQLGISDIEIIQQIEQGVSDDDGLPAA